MKRITEHEAPLLQKTKETHSTAHSGNTPSGLGDQGINFERNKGWKQDKDMKLKREVCQGVGGGNL